MADKKESKMGVGLLFGMIIGAVGGIFLAPKSGKENRKAVGKKVGEMKDMIESGEMKNKIEDVFGNLSDESVKFYENVRDGVVSGVEEVKSMNKEDYGKLVQKVIDNVKQGTKVGSEQLMKLKDQFMKDFPLMKEEAEKKTRKPKEKLLADKKDSK